MSGVLPESIFQNSVPAPPSNALSLPFRSSFGAPAPVSTNLGVPFPVSGGDVIKGPTKFINQSVTHHYVASYDINDLKSKFSSQERVKNLNVGDMVFARGNPPGLGGTPDSRVKFPMTGGSTTVELFNVPQLNNWLKERCETHTQYNKKDGYYESPSDLLKEFYFLGVIKNSVDSNGGFDVSRRNTSRMLNLVVSKKATALNIFPYIIMSGQNLWFIVKKVPYENNLNGKRIRPCRMRWMIIPWTSTEHSRPPMNRLVYYEGSDDKGPGKMKAGTCIYVGKAAQTVLDMGESSVIDNEHFPSVIDKVERLSRRPQEYVKNNLELFVKS